MNIYHISYSLDHYGTREVTLSFQGCNFECIGCLRKRSKYDIYADKEERIDMSLEGIIQKVNELKPHRVYFGGYEPTLDPDLISIIKTLSRADRYLCLCTNGSKLDEDYVKELRRAGINQVFLSVKAFDPGKHIYYTKVSNELSLRAISLLSKMEDEHFMLHVETILIPGVNDPVDIEKLATFISEIDPTIPLWIDPWVPTSEEFREPTKQELIEAVSRAMKHLYVVSYLPLHSEISEIRKTRKKTEFVNCLARE